MRDFRTPSLKAASKGLWFFLSFSFSALSYYDKSMLSYSAEFEDIMLGGRSGLSAL